MHGRTAKSHCAQGSDSAKMHGSIAKYIALLTLHNSTCRLHNGIVHTAHEVQQCTGPLQTRSVHKLRQCERLLHHSTVQRIPPWATGTGQIHMCQTANAQKHMWQPAMRARECRAKARSTRPAAQARMGASNVFARMPCNSAATNRPRMPYFLFFKKCRAASVCWLLLLPNGSMQGEAPAPVHCAPGHADHASAHVCVAVLTMLVHICVTQWCAQMRAFHVQTCASGHASGSVTGDGATCAVSCPRTMQRASGGRPRGGIGAAHVPPVPPAPVHATLQCMTCARTAPAAGR